MGKRNSPELKKKGNSGLRTDPPQIKEKNLGSELFESA